MSKQERKDRAARYTNERAFQCCSENHQVAAIENDIQLKVLSVVFGLLIFIALFV